MPKRTTRKQRVERAKATIKGLLKRGVAGNIRKLSHSTLQTAQAHAPKTHVKAGAVKSGFGSRRSKHKTITRGSAKAELKRRYGDFK
jgi:hypothetical protein